VADGTLYVHFNDRIDLFLALIQDHLPPFVEPLKRLQERVGRRTVRANLTEVLEAAMVWHQDLLPIFAAVSADPQLRIALSERLKERGDGPHRAVQAVERYLIAERTLGRIHPKSDAKAASLLLFSASHFWNSAMHGIDNDLGFSRQRLIKDIINALIAGLVPAEKTPVRKRVK
jgi:AcrR family transcriptional regulator